MKKLRLNILICALLSVLSISAQVKIEVASQVREGQKFVLTVVTDDASAQAPSKIQIPNCQLIYGGAQSTSISTTIINGKQEMRQSKRISYTFAAEKASTVTIPSIPVTISGKTVNTKPQKLTILPSGQNSSATNRTAPIFDDIPDGASVSPFEHFSANDVFVKIVMDKSTVYQQEPVVATVKLYSRLNMGVKFQMLSQPTFEGFLSEELNITSPQGVETIDGDTYNTYIVKRSVLYPQKSGNLKITSGTYEVTLEDIITVNTGLLLPDHRIVEKTIKTKDKALTLKVLPLPEPRPASFDGAVGDFQASADLSSTHLRTNDPATYTVTITGTGNIKYLKTPKLDLPAGFDQYTPKTNIDANYSGGDITGKYVATFTIVPQEVGDFEIPPMEFSYFNPQTKQYRTIDLHAYKVRVDKGSTSVEQKEVEKGMTDILHIHTNHPALKHTQNYVFFKAWYWVLYAIVALIFITTIFIYRRQIRLNADVRGRRLARAMRVAMKRFKEARRMMDNHNSDRFYEEINKALTGYLSDKLGIPASQLVRDNIAQQLTQYGADNDTVANIITILDECEMARFTPMHSDSDMSQLYDKVVEAVKSIENVKK